MLFWLRRPLGEIPPSPPLAKGGGGGICLAKGGGGGDFEREAFDGAWRGQVTTIREWRMKQSHGRRGWEE
jgi:hypothetical protein